MDITTIVSYKLKHIALQSRHVLFCEANRETVNALQLLLAPDSWCFSSFTSIMTRKSNKNAGFPLWLNDSFKKNTQKMCKLMQFPAAIYFPPPRAPDNIIACLLCLCTEVGSLWTALEHGILYRIVDVDLTFLLALWVTCMKPLS